MKTSSRSLRRSFLVSPLAVAAVLLAALWLVPRVGDAANAWGSFKGRIMVSDVEYGTGYATDAAMITGIKKQSKTVFKGDGAWALNMMVFLKEAPGADKINIVYYDVTKKPREQINFNEVGVRSDQKIVQLNGVSVSKDLGFVKGHKYDVLATRLIGGKEKVYAKTTLTLK